MRKYRVWLVAIGILVISKLVVAWTDFINISNTQKPSNFPSIMVDDQEKIHVTWAENYFDISKISYTCCDGKADEFIATRKMVVVK